MTTDCGLSLLPLVTRTVICSGPQGASFIPSSSRHEPKNHLTHLNWFFSLTLSLSHTSSLSIAHRLSLSHISRNSFYRLPPQQASHLVWHFPIMSVLHVDLYSLPISPPSFDRTSPVQGSTNVGSQLTEFLTVRKCKYYQTYENLNVSLVRNRRKTVKFKYLRPPEFFGTFLIGPKVMLVSPIRRVTGLFL